MNTEVLVVGAGPVGLLLAGDLAAAGMAVLVADRLPEPMAESRASQLSTRTAELLAERGLEGLLAEATPEPAGHFAGLSFPLTSVGGPWAGNWKVPQFRTEAALTARATALGVRILRPYELVGLSGDGVARFRGGAEVRADWVVGCDGVAGAVRGLAGFAVDRVPPTRELLRADVVGIEVPTRRFERTGRGLAVAMTRDGVTRVMVHQLGRPPAPRTGPPAFAELVGQWRAVTGDDLSAGTAIWLDAFDNERGLVTDYRRGRVLLAGDAAHWHLPIGGQALNVGLQDAAALGAALPAGRLDDYATQRRRAAAVIGAVTAQEELLLGGPPVDPLRAVLADLVRLPAAAGTLARGTARQEWRLP